MQWSGNKWCENQTDRSLYDFVVNFGNARNQIEPEIEIWKVEDKDATCCFCSRTEVGLFLKHSCQEREKLIGTAQSYIHTSITWSRDIENSIYVTANYSVISKKSENRRSESVDSNGSLNDERQLQGDGTLLTISRKRTPATPKSSTKSLLRYFPDSSSYKITDTLQIQMA